MTSAYHAVLLALSLSPPTFISSVELGRLNSLTLDRRGGADEFFAGEGGSVGTRGGGSPALNEALRNLGNWDAIYQTALRRLGNDWENRERTPEFARYLEKNVLQQWSSEDIRVLDRCRANDSETDDDLIVMSSDDNITCMPLSAFADAERAIDAFGKILAARSGGYAHEIASALQEQTDAVGYDYSSVARYRLQFALAPLDAPSLERTAKCRAAEVGSANAGGDESAVQPIAMQNLKVRTYRNSQRYIRFERDGKRYYGVCLSAR